ncbi:uncharacterized protein PG986_004359 [Apiospora aurea]|uniref:Uncharacterized protein n=1 Tax=Apiospora aurea TaxID=335848 RepID=A0ABR1QMC9_9PEZI
MKVPRGRSEVLLDREMAHRVLTEGTWHVLLVSANVHEDCTPLAELASFWPVPFPAGDEELCTSMRMLVLSVAVKEASCIQCHLPALFSTVPSGPFTQTSFLPGGASKITCRALAKGVRHVLLAAADHLLPVYQAVEVLGDHGVEVTVDATLCHSVLGHGEGR